LSIILTNADADIDGSITHNGKKLSGSIEVRFHNTHWNVESVNGSKLFFELQSMLRQISSFQLKINISGNIESTRIKITSDLDSVLGQIVRERINTTLVRFEKDLHKEFELQLDNWLAESDMNMKELGKLQADLLSRIRNHRDVLKQIIF
jgi:imidazoleglycerol phosphate dehydratase HisB